MNLDNLSINTIRTLGIDAINKAKSGHPGIVLGAAPIIYSIFAKNLVVNPSKPNWINRDRFVLAAGHGSMLLYAALHLSGFEVSLEDIKQFRQLGSATPGHPEYGHTPGVDATSGPLGQGIPMTIGMAIAEKFLATKFNKTNLEVFNHYSYALCGDGDLQEGVTQEAMSFAGNLGLAKVIVLYDSNDVQSDARREVVLNEDNKNKYEAMGWHYEIVKDGTDLEDILKAIEKAKKTDKPSLIEVKTKIGYKSPLEGSHKTHGAPLGLENALKTKQALGWDYTEEFFIPEEVKTSFKDQVLNRGLDEYNNWLKVLETYKLEYPKEYNELENILNDNFDLSFLNNMPVFNTDYNQATRNSSGEVLNYIADNFAYILGGSCDLAHSNKSLIDSDGILNKDDFSQRNIYFGIREFAMGAMINGIKLHKGLMPYGATFLVFADYMKSAIRMAAIQKLGAIHIFSHDSIAVGEDGATHHPVEQLAMLRSIPNNLVLRPADANEVSAAWRIALEREDGPTSLIITRQGLPTFENNNVYQDVLKGAYIFSKEQGPLDGIILATGSEVSLAVDTQKLLEKDNIFVRVVSMPSFELFDKQSNEYKESVLPSNTTKRMALEMASSFGWHKYVGIHGTLHTIDKYGESGKASDVMKAYGFSVEAVYNHYKKIS